MSLHRIIHNFTFKLRKYILPSKLGSLEAQDYIYDLLNGDKPCMIGRFGSVEIQGTVNGTLCWPFSLMLRKRIYHHLINNAGFFPVNKSEVKKFARTMKESMTLCDCLASWRIEESLFRRRLKKSKKVSLDALMPVDTQYNIKYKWQKALEGKKILVISPFAELIELQYNSKRELLWDNPNILPQFKELHTLKSINSIGGNCEFSSWFEALDWMEEETKKIDFDIAILGCGAYGFPLAARIKKNGKKAIHVGGATQLMFGIKGKRWNNAPFINEHWVSPRIEDRPKGWEKVEGGCYW